jgi:Carboxypeptidase activation peptide
VIRVTPQSTEQLSSIRHLEDKWTSLDFWRSPTKIDVPVDIFIGPEEYAAFDQEISSLNLSPTVIIQDVQR